MNQLYNSYLEINLATLDNNITTILDTLDNCQCIPVLKGNAYGLGIQQIAKRICANEKIKTVAISHIIEGIELRNIGIKQDILVLAGVPNHLLPMAVTYDLQLAVYHPTTITLLNKLGQEQNKIVSIQIKIETGLNRIGVKQGQQLENILSTVKKCKNIHLSGIFSHFYSGEIENNPDSIEQYNLFKTTLSQIEKTIPLPPMIHLCNSGASDWFADAFFTAVRLGRRLYMDTLSAPTPTAIKELASWRTSVTNIIHIKAGESVSYNKAWTAKKDSKIAILCVGYGDGLSCECAKVSAPVLVGEQQCNLVATCMDQCFVDVTNTPCHIGQEVTFFGYSSGGTFLSSQLVADTINTDGVTLYSQLTSRVGRVYIN